MKNRIRLGALVLASVFVVIFYFGPVSAQSDRDGRLNKNEVQDSRTKARPLDRAVDKSQPVYLPRLNTEKVEILGDHWRSDDEKRAALDDIQSETEKQIRNRMQRLGYDCVLDPDGSKLKAESRPNAVVIDCTLDQAGHGKEHPVIAVTVVVRDAKDPNQIYGKFSDGGMVGQVTARIAARFRLALKAGDI